MNSYDFIKKLSSTADKTSKIQFNPDPGDYQKDGLWYCGQCHTPRQVVLDFGTVQCLCKCRENSKLAKERAIKHQEEVNVLMRGIDKGYQDKYFKDSDDQKVIEFAKNYVEKFKDYFKPNNIGLFIYGEFGNGKTTIASMIANELVEREFSVIMLTINSALERYTNDISFKKTIEGADLVIFDDFGMSRFTEFQNERLSDLIDARYKVKKPLIVTTNLNRQQLASIDDMKLARACDRVIEMTHPILIDNPGRRKKMSQSRFTEVDSVLKGDANNEK